MGSGTSQPVSILRDRTALIALIEAGLTFDEIAARAGCSVATLRRAARRLRLPPSKPGRKPTPVLADREALAALIASGLSTAQIAEHTGRSTNVVRAWANVTSSPCRSIRGARLIRSCSATSRGCDGSITTAGGASQKSPARSADLGRW